MKWEELTGPGLAQAAREIGEIDSRAARWIASDAIRDLAREDTRRVRTRGV